MSRDLEWREDFDRLIGIMQKEAKAGGVEEPSIAIAEAIRISTGAIVDRLDAIERLVSIIGLNSGAIARDVDKIAQPGEET